MQTEKKTIIFMVGLPARGKSYTATKLQKMLTDQQLRVKLFNNGALRREQGIKEEKSLHNFFDQSNTSHNSIREEIARKNLDLALNYLENDGDIAIYDAVNGTKQRRQSLVERTQEKFNGNISLIFIELFCTDTDVINRNIREVKTQSDDYINTQLTIEERICDFKARLQNYEKCYEPLNFEDDKHLTFIRSIDSAHKIEANEMKCDDALNILRLLLEISLPGQALFSV